MHAISRYCHLVLICLSCNMALAAAPDFTSAAGMARSCAGNLQAQPAATPQAQQAWVLCRDIATAKRLLRLADHYSPQQQGQLSLQQLDQEGLRVAFAALRDEVRTTRRVLEKIVLRSKDDGLLLVPATWGSDLNGDGTLTPEEQYLFAIPKRPVAGTPDGEDRGADSRTQQYYQRHYQLEARFRVDQSDVQWLLGYHYFLEASAELSAAFDNGPGTLALRVRDPAALRRAHGLLLAGVNSSEKLRQLVLAETDDEEEWIAHPGQRSSVFPETLSEPDFDAWKTLLGHILPVLEGKQLLAAPANASLFESLFSSICADKQGLNVASLFRRQRNEVLVPESGPVRLAGCQPITARHPVSPLLRYLSGPVQRGMEHAPTGMAMLRKLFWVN